MGSNVTPLSEWTPRGKWKRLSPCGRYQIDKVYIASEGGDRYYAYFSKGGPKIGGPFVTADEAWGCCEDNAMDQPQNRHGVKHG